jgi:preprotein translocase subunit Sss1
MKTNKYQTKVFATQRSLTDYQKEEKRWWTKVIVIAALALLLIGGLGIAGTFEVENYRAANGMEAK